MASDWEGRCARAWEGGYVVRAYRASLGRRVRARAHIALAWEGGRARAYRASLGRRVRALALAWAGLGRRVRE